MSDPTPPPQPLVAETLRRLLAHGAAMRLVAGRNEPGLFPSWSARARAAAEYLRDQGWIVVDELAASSAAVLTDAGREWLFANDPPRILLEDLLRATEAQTDALAELHGQWRLLRDRLTQQHAAIKQVLDRLAPEAADEELDAAIESALADHEEERRPAACTLGELFDSVTARVGRLSVGRFHDALRGLHAAGRLRLAPWTGPLYQLPDPARALLIGHEVLYYVDRIRNAAA